MGDSKMLIKGERDLARDADCIERHERSWVEFLRAGFRLVGIVVAGVTLYLLSFGPVGRYYGRTTTVATPPPTVSAGGQTVVMTSVRTLTYPGWVGVVYYPAMILRGNRLYGSYLQWWDEGP